MADVDELVRVGYEVMPDVLPSAWTSTIATRGAELAGDTNALLEFPFADDDLNAATFHPAVLDLARSIIGVDDIRLTQSAIWVKSTPDPALDQDLHVDYSNNSLVVPVDVAGVHGHLPMIVYYTDVGRDDAPTMVVSRPNSADRAVWPAYRPRDLDPQLYELEEPVLAPAGAVFAYTMSTFHRGTSPAPGGRRVAHHLVFRAAAAEWAGWAAWPRFGRRAEMQRFMTTATVEARTAIGFPAPGHDFWTAGTLAAVAQRYPDADLSDYWSAIG